MTMRANRAALLVLLAALAGGCSRTHLGRPEGSCTHIQAERQVQGLILCEDAWTCARPPNGRFDRVGLHRLAACEGADGPIVLYLPGMHMNGELPIVEPRNDLRAYLAVNGVRTWGLDYRTHVVPPDASPQDLQALSGWTADVFASDAAWAAGFVRGAEPGPLYLAGFSHGAALAYRLAAQRGERFAGLLILDGALPAGSTADRNGPAIDVGGSRLPFAERERLLAVTTADPGAPSPIAGYRTAGEALAQILYTAPAFGGDGGLANTRDNISDIRVLAMLLRAYDRWWPRATLDGSPPGPPDAPVPVLAFTSTRLGPEWIARVNAAARAFGGPKAIVRELPAYGHLDVLVGRRAARDVFEPSLSWLGGALTP
jgi:pimeloyl-ACP methyl ester carboxylesterase